MSNLLNNQIGQALINVGNVLQQQELTEFNTLRGAKLSLYHAHSITSKAEGELREHQEQSQQSAEQNKIAAIGVNATSNVVVAAKAAVLDASSTTSNAAAAAASVQKAATALTTLSGNIATTLAVANTLDKGSKIQTLVEKANKATNEAAKLAEEASLIALNLTIEASQSRAASVVTQSDDVKSKMVALQKALSDTFSKQQDLITEDEAAVTSAVADESQQAGIYKTALAEDHALRQSAAFINRYINNNLTVKINEFKGDAGENMSGDTFTLSFAPFKDREGGLKIIHEHRLIIVKADDAVAFNVESAKSTPAKYYSLPNPQLVNGLYQKDFFLANVSNEIDSDNESLLLSLQFPSKPILAIDYTGQPIVRGTPYKFFVYVVYTTEYQSEYNDTNGLLSLPSESFTLRTPLPVVAGSDIAMQFYQKKGADAMRMIFKVPASEMKLGNGTDLNELMEFRAFIFNKNDKDAFNRNKKTDEQTKVLFELDDEFRLREEAYQQAKMAFETALSQEAPKYVVQQCKMEMDIAKAHYQTAKANYNNQVVLIDRWNESKISDFTFDADIAQTIPASNYSVATLNPHLRKELEKEAKHLSHEVDKYTEKIQANENWQKNHQEDYEELSRKIDAAVKKEEPLPNDIQAIQQTIADNISKLEASLNQKVNIKSEEEATAFKEHLGAEKTKQIELLELIIKGFHDLKEKENSDFKLSKEINEWRSKQKKISTEIVLHTAEKSMLQDELAMFRTEKAAVDLLLEKIKEDEADTYDYYEIINEDGDFTDNFGEPLVDGDSYCVAVLSMIKTTEPDAAPLFQGTLSDFSDETLFNLEQI